MGWWAALTGLISLAASGLTWWIAQTPRVRYRKLWARIRYLEEANRDALAKRQMVRVADLGRELQQLRVVQATLGALG